MKLLVAAKTIEADRLVFGSPRKFDPVPYLDSKTAAMYEEPGLSADKKLDLCPEFQSEPLFLRNCLVSTLPEKLSLYRELASTGRLIL